MAAASSLDGSENLPIGVCRVAWDLVWTPVLVVDAAAGQIVAANPAARNTGYSQDELRVLSVAHLLPEFPWREYACKNEPCAWTGQMHDRAGNSRTVECRMRSLQDVRGRFLLLAIDASQTAAVMATGVSAVDPLTGLLDRTAIAQRVSHALQRDREEPSLQSALLFLDLDNFKTVNDNWGHLTGDHVLCEAARRLKTAVRPTDLAARLGGDEFVVVLEGLRQTGDAEIVARRILDTLSAPIAEAGQTFVIRASIGIVEILGKYRGWEAVLSAADRAMYAAKQSGGATWRVAARQSQHGPG